MRRITNTVFRLLRGEKGSSEAAKKVEPFWGTARKRKGAIALDQALLELNKVGAAASSDGGSGVGGRRTDCEVSIDGDTSPDKLYLAGVAEFERGGGIPNSKAVAYWREASQKGHMNAKYRCVPRSYGLWVRSCGLWVTSYGVGLMGYGLCIKSYCLWVRSFVYRPFLCSNIVTVAICI